MRINCLSCGHKVELDDAYSDYEGEIRCMVCGTMLEVKIHDGLVCSVKRPVPAPPPSASRSTSKA
ncbi:MAG: hypothetical protein WCK47_08700 [bacterium]|nr:hypothetical protein [Candidatus Sumerlaeota bacterium]